VDGHEGMVRIGFWRTGVSGVRDKKRTALSSTKERDLQDRTMRERASDPPPREISKVGVNVGDDGAKPGTPRP
jgi:hypothetical protein